MVLIWIKVDEIMFNGFYFVCCGMILNAISVYIHKNKLLACACVPKYCRVCLNLCYFGCLISNNVGA